MNFKRATWLAVIGLLLMLLATGCGEDAQCKSDVGAVAPGCENYVSLTTMTSTTTTATTTAHTPSSTTTSAEATTVTVTQSPATVVTSVVVQYVPQSTTTTATPTTTVSTPVSTSAETQPQSEAPVYQSHYVLSSGQSGRCGGAMITREDTSNVAPWDGMLARYVVLANGNAGIELTRSSDAAFPFAGVIASDGLEFSGTVLTSDGSNPFQDPLDRLLLIEFSGDQPAAFVVCSSPPLAS